MRHSCNCFLLPQVECFNEEEAVDILNSRQLSNRIRNGLPFHEDVEDDSMSKWIASRSRSEKRKMRQYKRISDDSLDSLTLLIIVQTSVGFCVCSVGIIVVRLIRQRPGYMPLATSDQVSLTSDNLDTEIQLN